VLGHDVLDSRPAPLEVLAVEPDDPGAGGQARLRGALFAEGAREYVSRVLTGGGVSF
jgi:hypothetical protein